MSSTRLIVSLLSAAVLLVSFCGGALAQDAVAYDPDLNAVSIVWAGCAPEQSYMLFLLTDSAEPASIQAADILFMDQITADAQGVVSVLYAGPEFSSCLVCLSGEFPDSGTSPRIIGSFLKDSEADVLQTPENLKTIGARAFKGGAFTHVYLGNKVQSIGSQAFADCPNLVYIEIPASVFSIAADAFQGSPNVVIGCKENSAAYAFAVDMGIPFRLID